MKKRGLLLINLGTPDSPEPEDVGRYLREFLMDRHVIDIPWPLRWFLVNALIVPKRKHATGKLYRSIWGKDGSPLLAHHRALGRAVSERTRDEFEVVIAMRYGRPSIESAMRDLAARDLDEIVVFPLYPQYAESSTRTCQEECERAARVVGLRASRKYVAPFFDHPQFIRSLARRLEDERARGPKDAHVMMSFHGIPERHIKRTERAPGGHCLMNVNCCDKIVAANRDCYRAQCFATARALAKATGLNADQYTVTFQSRLGRTPWIRPYTDIVIEDFARAKTHRQLLVACPSFVADCLETVEEISVRARESFVENGGEDLRLVPGLNSEPYWADAVAEIAREARG